MSKRGAECWFSTPSSHFSQNLGHVSEIWWNGFWEEATKFQKMQANFHLELWGKSAAPRRCISVTSAISKFCTKIHQKPKILRNFSKLAKKWKLGILCFHGCFIKHLQVIPLIFFILGFPLACFAFSWAWCCKSCFWLGSRGTCASTASCLC